MPKGETSRPLNRAQKKAMATFVRLNREMQDKSIKNKLEIMAGKPYQDATWTLRNAAKDEHARKRMKEIGREEGATTATGSRRKIVRDSLINLSTSSIKAINKNSN